MSSLGVLLTADRIRTATDESPIVVLTIPGDTDFEAFFADTVFGRRYLEKPCSRFLGVYHGEDGVKEFQRKSNHVKTNRFYDAARRRRFISDRGSVDAYMRPGPGRF